MATTKAYEIGQLAGQLDVDSTGDITLTGNLDVSYSGFDSDFAAKTTTNLTEGDNLYYTTARADSDATVAAVAAISVTDAGGDGSLTYSNGAITYTGPSAAETRAHFSAGTGISINSGQISVNSSDNVTFADITTTGVLNGPATFYIDPAPVDSAGGLLVIRGDLQVDGTTTTVNSTTVTINDKNIVLADSAANASEADGAGITVEGANATITYDATNDEWDFNKDVNVTGNITVSGTVDGRDVATDGTKLDGIESGATADQTASEILTSIKTVDGSGSGLDADTLDGVQGSSYLRSDAIDTFTGQYLSLNSTGYLRTDNSGYFTAQSGGSGFQFYNGAYNTVRMHIGDTGNVGIGTNTPDAKLEVIGSQTIANNNGYFASTLTEASDYRMALKISPTRSGQTKGITLGAIGGADLTGIQAYDTSDNTSNPLSLNALGGNVGIGTSDPSDKLEIDIASSNTGITLTDNGDGFFPQISYDANRSGAGQSLGKFSGYWNGTEVSRIEFISGNDTTNKDDGELSLYTRSSGGSLTSRIRIGTTGNVGIGTTTPSTKFHVKTGTNQNFNVFGPTVFSNGVTLASTTDGFGAYVEMEQRATQFAWHNGTIERMRIVSNGNVGIGTNNPQAKLEVDGIVASINSGQGAGQLQLQGYGGTGYINMNGTGNLIFRTGSSYTERARFHPEGYLELKSSDAYNQLVLTPAGTNAPASINFNTPGTGRAKLKVQNNEYISILSTGNVGIGTTNPASILHAKGGSIINEENNGGFVFLKDGEVSSTNRDYYGALLRVDNNGYHVTTNNGGFSSLANDLALLHHGSLIFATAPATGDNSTNYASGRMIIDPDGDVGIGTRNPSQKLEVNGNVLSQGYYGTGTTTGNIVFSLGTSTQSPSMAVWGQDHATYPGQVHIVSRSSNASADSGKISFWDFTGSSFQRNVTIDKTGNVGIGTDSPSQKLHVDGIILAGKAGNSSANLPALLVNASGVNPEQAAIAIQQGTGEGDTIIFADFNPYVEYGINTDNGADAIDFTGGGATGSIGINKTLYNNNGDARTAHVKMRVNLNSGILEVGGGVKGAFVPYNTTLQVSMGASNSSYTWSGLPSDVWMMMSVHISSTDTDQDDHYDVKFGPNVDYGYTWGDTYPTVNVPYGFGIVTHPGDSQMFAGGYYGLWAEIMAKTNSSGQMILSIVGSNGGSGVTVRTKGYFLG